MISPDTIKLLRECDAGIKMGVSSIDEVLGYVHAAKMKKILIECKEEHDAINQHVKAAVEGKLQEVQFISQNLETVIIMTKIAAA